MPLTDVQRINFEVVVTGLYAAGGGSKAKPTKNVMHYKRTNFGAVFVGTAFNTAWLAANKAGWKAFINLSWTMVKMSIRCIDDPIEGEIETLVGEAGDVTGDCLPNSNAAVLSKKTALRGKHYRGRMYIPGVSEDDNVNNALTAGAKTRLDTVATNLLAVVTDANGVTFSPALLSASLWNLVAVPPIPTVTVLSSITARKQIGTMNSRKSPVVS